MEEKKKKKKDEKFFHAIFRNNGVGCKDVNKKILYNNNLNFSVKYR